MLAGEEENATISQAQVNYQENSQLNYKITKYTTTGYEKMHNQILKGTSPGELESQLQSKFTTELQKTQPNMKRNLKILLNCYLGEAIPRPRSKGARRESFEGGWSFFCCFFFSF